MCLAERLSDLSQQPVSPSRLVPFQASATRRRGSQGEGPQLGVSWTVGRFQPSGHQRPPREGQAGRASRPVWHALYCRWMRGTAARYWGFRVPHPLMTTLPCISGCSQLAVRPYPSDPSRLTPYSRHVPPPHIDQGSAPLHLAPSAWQALPLTADS